MRHLHVKFWHIYEISKINKYFDLDSDMKFVCWFYAVINWLVKANALEEDTVTE